MSATFRRTPAYRTVLDSGTEDDDSRFTVEVRIGTRTWGRGVGRSKQNAESAAAQEALASRAEADA